MSRGEIAWEYRDHVGREPMSERVYPLWHPWCSRAYAGFLIWCDSLPSFGDFGMGRIIAPANDRGTGGLPVPFRRKGGYNLGYRAGLRPDRWREFTEAGRSSTS